MKRMRAVESDSVKSARKAKDKLHKACERASEIRERTLHRNKTECAWQACEGHETVIVTTQVQLHALMRRRFGTSVPFINFGLIQFSTIPAGMKPLGLFCEYKGVGGQEQFPGKGATLKLVLLQQLLLSTKNLTSENQRPGRNSLHFCFTSQNFLFESIATHDLI